MNQHKRRGKAEAGLDLEGAYVAIVASHFNDFIVDRLVAGARLTLSEYGIDEARISLLQVPGAFELPLAAREIAASGEFDAVIALGTVIRGETAHFDFVCTECAAGLMRVSLDYGLPLGFGVLTVDTEQQALARAGDSDNKGSEAAQAALEMISLLRRVRQ